MVVVDDNWRKREYESPPTPHTYSLFIVKVCDCLAGSPCAVWLQPQSTHVISSRVAFVSPPTKSLTISLIFFDSTLDHHYLTYLHLSHLLRNTRPTNGEFTTTPILLFFYDHPHHPPRWARHQGRLCPKNPLPHIRRWRILPCRMGPRPDTVERHEPHWGERGLDIGA